MGRKRKTLPCNDIVLDLEPFRTAFPTSSSKGEDPDISRLAAEIRGETDGIMVR
jgi:hypothetical protein